MEELRTEDTGAVEELRAVRLTLVDEHGNVRAALGPDGDGATGLRLYDDEQRPRVELAVAASGAADLKLHGRDGDVCAWLAVGRHGDPSLYLQATSRHDLRVRGHAKLSVDEHGCPVLSLHDRDGAPRVLLGLDEQTGMATLCYADGRGNSRLLLGEDGGHLGIFDGAGRSRGVPTLPLGRGGPRSEPDPRIDDIAERLARLEQAETPPPAEPDPRIAERLLELEQAHARARQPAKPDPRIATLAARLARLEQAEARPPAEPDPPVATEPDPRVDTLAARLLRLERSRTRHWVSTLALVLLGALLGGAAGQLVVPTPPPPQPAASSSGGPVVVARELILADGAGATRMRLAVLPDGTPLLWMTDALGTSTAELSVLSDSGALLRLNGGRSSIALATPPRDLPSLGAYDGSEVLFQAPSHVARFLPPDPWP